MLIHRDTLRAALYAADDGTDRRYYMAALQIHPDGRVIATDGHMLICARNTHNWPEEDWPAKDLPVLTAQIPAPVCLPISLAKKLIDASKTKRTSIPILQCIQIGVDATGRTFAAATDLETPLVGTILTGADVGIFPATDRVMVGDDRPHLTLKLGGALLKAIVEAAKAITPAHTSKAHGGIVELQIPTEEKYQDSTPGATVDDPRVSTGAINAQVRVLAKGDNTEWDGVVMPIRV